MIKNNIKKLIDNLPVSMQNTIFTIYGISLNVERYGGNYRKYLQSCLKDYRLNRKMYEQIIAKRLKQTVDNAMRYVPYYKENVKWNGRNFDPQSKYFKHAFLELPLLEKSQIRGNEEQFVDQRYLNKRKIEIHTTGTTGTPLRVFCDKEARRKNYSFFNRFLILNGIRLKGKRATLGGRIIVPIKQKKPPFWRYSAFQKNLLFSSYHIQDRNLTSYLDKLNEFKPEIIDTYPSSIYSIADYAMRKNIDCSEVTRFIITSAETLFDWQRKIIEKVFKVPIFDQYGSAEMCNFVGQCTKGRYHIHTDYSFIEFLRENGDPAKSGEEAEIVCTSFINPIMPLIRYRIGDRGVLSKNSCDCGSPFPVMDHLLGRMDDVILTPDGRKIGRLSPVLKGFPIKEAQYVQNNIHTLEVNIIRSASYNFDTERNLISEIRKRVGCQIDIKIKYVKKIERGKGGKFRTVVSNIAQ